MKIRSQSKSHIVELNDGSRWKIFPGDLDIPLKWEPETDLRVEQIDDDTDGSRVRVIPATEEWPVGQVKQALKEG
jgi:hypothetical protein